MFQYVPGPLRKKGSDKLVNTKPTTSTTPNPKKFRPNAKTPKVLELPKFVDGGSTRPPVTRVMEPKSSESSSSSSESSTSSKSDSYNRRRGVRNSDKYTKVGLPPHTYVSTPNEFNSSSSIQPTLLNQGQSDFVKFSTDLKPTVTLNEFKTSSYANNEVIPKLLINIASYGVGFTASGAAQDTYMNEIFQTYNRDVIATIRNTVTLSSWSLPKFKSYFWKVAYALEYYYALDSILSYDPKTTTDKDKSLCIINYQSRFQDFSIIQKKDYLEKVLRGCWFPPRLSQLIRWTYQFYKVSDLEQAIVARYVPSEDFLYDGTKAFSTTTVANTLTTIISDLITSSYGVDNVVISSILSQVYPDGRITNLPKSAIAPNYDRNWLEVFYNQPNIFVDENNSNSTTLYPFSVSGLTTDIPYYVDRPLSEIDGFCFALQGISVGTAYGTGGLGVIAGWQISFLEPFNSTTMGTSNRGNKYAVDDVNGTCVRRDTYTYNSGVPDAHLIYKPTTTTYAGNSAAMPGWQRVYFDNINAPTINLGYFMDWLFGNLQSL